MWQYLGDEAGGALEPACDVARGGEETRRLTQRNAVEVVYLPAHDAILGGLPELSELGPVELVRLSELMHQPDPLLRMAHGV